MTPGFKDPECHTASLPLRKEITFLQALLPLMGSDAHAKYSEICEISLKGKNTSVEDVESFLSG